MENDRAFAFVVVAIGMISTALGIWLILLI
jgi:hypothetical protein